MIAVVILLVVAALCLAVTYVLYQIVFYSPHRGQGNIYHIPKQEQYMALKDQSLALIGRFAAEPCERISVRSHDGLCLVGRYYRGKEGAPRVICFHGYRSTGIRDFCGGCRYLLDTGRSVLLVDQRGHGESGGHTITFGVKERLDCLTWVQYAAQRFGADTPMVLYGVSMGAATVLMASGLELPPNVRGIIADCPYSTAEGIIRKVCRDIRLPDRPLYPLVALGARLFGRFRLSDGDAPAAVARAKVPILIIHGEDDRFVPCGMSETIRQANPAMTRRETFPRAGHGISYLLDPARYERCLEEFISGL